MHCLSDLEALEWVHLHGIDCTTDSGSPELVGDYDVKFAAPMESRTQQRLARQLLSWIGSFEEILVWFTDWPFQNAEEAAIIAALRLSNGEQRPLIEAPAHLFAEHEINNCTAMLYLAIGFGWDAFVLPRPFRGNMLHTSHEDFVWAEASDLVSIKVAQSIPRQYGLTIYRELPPTD